MTIDPIPCTRCGQPFPLDHYRVRIYRQPHPHTSRVGMCRECERAANREHCQAHRAKNRDGDLRIRVAFALGKGGGRCRDCGGSCRSREDCTERLSRMLVEVRPFWMWRDVDVRVVGVPGDSHRVDTDREVRKTRD